ncbi:hypothetical protein HF521_021726 [Silurus meridionalis]|uniref:Ig-like domain-containing protein n=1 Tax=Silurus meridionalis TaxID=175797 RepID=A0A8T0BC61_SILME|nr:hypothetical protein HF521_021726 [Silurus meridionalis]
MIRLIISLNFLLYWTPGCIKAVCGLQLLLLPLALRASMISVIISLSFLLYQTPVLAGENVVTQIPSVSWHLKGESAEIKCSHNKDFNYNQMYWYIQRQGESMELIVYTTASSKEFGSVDKNKFLTVKEIAQNGSLTVKNLDTGDSAVYFCAVGKHSVTELLHC